MIWLRILSFLCVVMMLGCGQASLGRLDAKTAAIFDNATKVEVFRIDGKYSPGDPKAPPLGENIGGYPILSRGKDQRLEFARKLASVLNDGSTYSTSRAMCFWPGVAFRVWRDEEPVDLLICFYCHNFYLGPANQGRVMETASFMETPAVPKLLKLAKEAFPDDKDIQDLEK
jgi:hypothetical protein